MDETIRIFLADDHAVVLRGLQALIGTEPDMEVVGTANNGRSAVTGVSNATRCGHSRSGNAPLRPVSKQLSRSKRPHPPVKILIVTSFSDDEHVFARQSSAVPSVTCSKMLPQKLLRAIRDVHAEKRHCIRISPSS